MRHFTHHPTLHVVLLALSLLAPAVAEGKRGARRAYYAKHGQQVHSAGKPRLLLHVDTYNTMPSYSHYVASTTIAIKVDRSSGGIPHTSVRIGDMEYDMMSTRSAGRKVVGEPDFGVKALGAVYHVPAKALKLYQHHFEEQVEVINRFNLHPFHFHGHPALLKRGAAEGTWEIVNTQRAQDKRVVHGRLVEHDGRHYLESPNVAAAGEAPHHVRVPVKKLGQNLELEQLTCASFVFANLQDVALANPTLKLPQFNVIKSARYAGATMVGEIEGRGQLSLTRRQNLTVLYQDRKRPADLKAALVELGGR